MWYTGPCWLPVLAAVFGRPNDRHIGWHSHIFPPEGTDHWDSDTLEKDTIYVLISVSAEREWATISLANINTGIASLQMVCDLIFLFCFTESFNRVYLCIYRLYVQSVCTD